MNWRHQLHRFKVGVLTVCVFCGVAGGLIWGLQHYPWVIAPVVAVVAVWFVGAMIEDVRRLDGGSD
jgi:cytochrome c biogenesis protein CcdA